MALFVVITLWVFSACLLSKVKGRLAKAYLLVVLSVWLVPLSISLFNPLGLYEVSIKVYLIISIGIIFFIFGYLSLNNAKYKLTNVNRLGIVLILLNNWRFLLVYIGGIALISFLALSQWQLIVMQEGMGNLKVDFFELVFNNNSILYFLYQSLLVPLFFFSCSIFTIYLVSGRFSVKLLVVLLYILLFSFVGGKRGYFSVFLQYFVVSYIIYRYTYVSSLVKKKPISLLLISIVGVAMFIGAAFMTSLSTGGLSNDRDMIKKGALSNVENLLVYQIGPYRSLDYALNHDYIEKYGGYTYGRSTLGGMIDYYGCSILKMAGISITQARALSMAPLQQNSITIGKDRDWNFSYTSYYYFLFDFGIMGVLLFSFLFGKLVRYSVNKYVENGTVGALCFTSYMFIGCMLFQASWFNIQLYAQATILLFLFLGLYEKKHYKKISCYEIIIKKDSDLIQYNKISSN